jgi:hypothetical protein
VDSEVRLGDVFTIAGLSVAVDATPSRWVVDGVDASVGMRYRVASLVPGGFEKYVRVLHPALLDVDDGEVPVSWATVATGSSAIMHKAAQWDLISREHSTWSESPIVGALPLNIGALLLDLLELEPTGERCWCAAWEGGNQSLKAAPRFDLPFRRMCLYETDLLALRHLMRGPERCGDSLSVSSWWPDDHSWYVSTDVDLDSTYIGASGAAANRILSSLEAFAVDWTHIVSIDSDTLNAR